MKGEWDPLILPFVLHKIKNVIQVLNDIRLSKL